jgi:hypothetical protein
MSNNLWPEEPIMIVSGQPYVYCKEWVHTGHLYVGSCFRGLPGYDGSLGRAGEAEVRAAHAAIGAPIESRMILLWTATATQRQTTDMEMAKIAQFRNHYGERVVNRFPIRDWSGHMRWVHDQQNHVDYTINFPHGTFSKRQSSNVRGACSQCKLPWGADIDNTHWSKLIYTDGRSEWLNKPNEGGNVYNPCIRRKDELLGIIPAKAS